MGNMTARMKPKITDSLYFCFVFFWNSSVDGTLGHLDLPVFAIVGLYTNFL